MKIFGWRLVDWQFGPWHWPNVNTIYEHYGDARWRDRFIIIGPVQTRWCK